MILATVCSEVASGLSVSLFVIGSRYCGGFGMPADLPGASRRQQRLRLHRAIDDDFIFLGKEIGFIGSENRRERDWFAAACPNGGCANP